MEWGEFDKVIIVEGSSDRRKVASVLNEDVEIRCTNGTISLTKLDELVDELIDRDVYLLLTQMNQEKSCGSSSEGKCRKRTTCILIKCTKKWRAHPNIISQLCSYLPI